jgi:hypothetical protein
MRIVALLIVVLGVYLYFVRHSPVAPVVDEITAVEAAPLSSGPRAAATPAPTTAARTPGALIRPINRTNEVLGLVKKRNGNGEF